MILGDFHFKGVTSEIFNIKIHTSIEVGIPFFAIRQCSFPHATLNIHLRFVVRMK